MCSKRCVSVDRKWQCKAVRSTIGAYRYDFIGCRRRKCPRWCQLANCFLRAKRYARADRSFSSSVNTTLTPLNFQPRWRWGRWRGSSSSLSQRYRDIVPASHKFVRKSNCQDRFKLRRERRQTILKDRNWRWVRRRDPEYDGTFPSVKRESPRVSATRLPRNVEVFVENAKKSEGISVYPSLSVFWRLVDVNADQRVRS